MLKKQETNNISQKLLLMQRTHDQALLVNTHSRAESQLHSVEQAAKSSDFYSNFDTIDSTCFNQDDTISSLNEKFLKFLHHLNTPTAVSDIKKAMSTYASDCNQHFYDHTEI